MTDSPQTIAGLGPWRSDPDPAAARFPADAVGASIADRLLAIGSARLDARALSSPAGTWSYAELLDDIRLRAGGLVDAAGHEPRPVALMMAHDGPLVVTLLSVIVSGHIVVILDPTSPSSDHDHIVAESRPALVVHDEANAAAATALAGRAGLDAVLADELTGPLPEVPSRGPSDPVMLAFTSGTSGSPKGAVITNGVIMNLVRGATDALGITAEDRMPMLFPTSLAVAAYPLFLPLLNGGTLATLDVRSVGLAPVADFLERERITVAYLAPTVVRFLVDALEGRTFADLRLVALGGELVDAEVVALADRLFGADLLANGYGTTETGVIALYVIDPSAPPVGAVPAGHVVPDVEILVLGDDGSPLPVGEPGEIAVASPYVFLGYWGHPEVNLSVLFDDPRGRPGWRLYRTGDFGHLDASGALVVSGRVDTKVKVRGRFVVIGDVEARVREQEGVADAVVTARVVAGITELVAYVVPRSGSTLDGPSLRRALLVDDEAYRVPSRWIVLDDLPHLPNGKVDRRSLPAFDDVAVDVAAGSEAVAEPPVALTPVGDVVTVTSELRSIWELLLPVRSVGLDDDFFELGGDSLLAAQMVLHVERRLGVTIPMGELVGAHTVRQLAEVVARRGSEGRATTTVHVLQEGAPGRPRLWFVHDLQGSAFRVRHLAAALGPDQPVSSFESPLLDGAPNDFRTLEAFAARYVADLRRAQPDGPYWLAGYSFGGVCAYEMARQLVAVGEEVAFVGVVDVGPGYRGPGWHGRRSPFRPWFGVAKPPTPGSSFPRQVAHYARMLRTSPSGTARHLMVRTGLSRVVDPFRFRRDLREHGRVRPEWRLWYSWEEHWKLAATAWDRSRTYAGAVDLFWADESAASDASMGWDPLVGSLRIHRFPGDHEGILEERGAGALARSLRPALDAVLDDRGRV